MTEGIDSGRTLRQTPLAHAAGCAAVPASTHHSAASAKPQAQRPAVLLTSQQAAREVFGVSERKFHEFRTEDWFTAVARPRVLGPRIVRWVRAELEAAALNCPTLTMAEPERLLRGKVEKLKRGGSKATTATTA